MIDFILDFISPRRCIGCGKIGCYFCPVCRDSIEIVNTQVCFVCRKPAFSGLIHPGCKPNSYLDGLVAVFKLTGVVRKAVHSLKYKYNTNLVKEFVTLFVDKLDNLSIKFNQSNLVVTPVPLHQARLNWRGFNQAELIAKEIAYHFQFSYQPLVLRRVKNTQPQVELAGKERKKNVFRAFEVVNYYFVQDRSLILVDDVATTGATLENCAYSLKKAGAKQVFGLVLASNLFGSY